MKTVAVLDYPSRYSFPPAGYGGIERWLWSVAYYSKEIGLKVIIVGPNWCDTNRFDLHIKESILELTGQQFILKAGQRVDYLVGGHEYWHSDSLRSKFEEISCASGTFQHMPDPVYSGSIFDRKRHHLFVYSEEMRLRFLEQRPHVSLCVAQGLNEEPIYSEPNNYAVWIGRLDRDKLPHLAVLAAKKLNMPIYLLGNPVRDSMYYKEYEELFCSSSVKRATSPGCAPGEVTGIEKMKLIAGAKVAFYTVNLDYIEAGASVFAEYLRCGVPVAALSWKGNDVPYSALGSQEKAGRIFLAHPGMPDEQVATGLAQAAEYAMNLDRREVANFGRSVFNPALLLTQFYDQLNNG